MARRCLTRVKRRVFVFSRTGQSEKKWTSIIRSKRLDTDFSHHFRDVSFLGCFFANNCNGRHFFQEGMVGFCKFKENNHPNKEVNISKKPHKVDRVFMTTKFSSFVVVVGQAHQNIPCFFHINPTKKNQTNIRLTTFSFGFPIFELQLAKTPKKFWVAVGVVTDFPRKSRGLQTMRRHGGVPIKSVFWWKEKSYKMGPLAVINGVNYNSYN